MIIAGCALRGSSRIRGYTIREGSSGQRQTAPACNSDDDSSRSREHCRGLLLCQNDGSSSNFGRCPIPGTKVREPGVFPSTRVVAEQVNSGATNVIGKTKPGSGTVASRLAILPSSNSRSHSGDILHQCLWFLLYELLTIESGLRRGSHKNPDTEVPVISQSRKKKIYY